jgi:ATP-dependent Lon protease
VDAGQKKEPLMPIKKEDSVSPKRRSGGGARRKKEMRVPSEIPLLPLRNTVIFPHQIVPLSVGRKKSLKVIEEITKGDKMMIVVAQKDGRIEDPGPEGLYEWGSVVQVVTVFKVPGGAENILVHGVCRAKVEKYVQEEPYIKVRITPVFDMPAEGVDVQAFAANLKGLFQRAAELAPYLTEDHAALVASTESAGRLADAVLWNLNVPIEEKQRVLELVDIKSRLEKTTYILNRELQILELGSKIQSEVAGEIDKSQREFYLRQQLRAIQKELGEDEDERTAEVRELKKRIDKAKLPAEAKKAAEKELDRLAKMPPAAAEYTVSRTYLDWILDLPWNASTVDQLDVSHARTILDEDHYDLNKVKKRILEFLAVRKLKKDMKGPILCFVGPPGVGKTSLGKSIARAMGRKFVRVSLGGMRDEAEIRGHRRTYVGALPGRIIQNLKKVGTRNPVFMLDEIDKMGVDFRGDPSSALLEVLDPEQNHSFSDHYLEVAFDLSNVLFIATANLMDPVAPALKDRMEVLELPGYTDEEKVRIARQFLVPKQLDAHGLTGKQLVLEEDAIRGIIGSYTREAGVRNLEREIAAVCRGAAQEVAEGATGVRAVREDALQSFIGPAKFFPEVKERMSRPGVATGLAWTPSGGDIIFIESTMMRGKGGLLLTGHLGDVMKESAQAALSYIRANAERFKISESIFTEYDIHIHVPAGAIPKDGPSAGITIYASLISLLTGKLVRNDVAMTGEITLRGLVLPVGGVKEKVLAAKRAGITHVVLPDKNRGYVEDISAEMSQGMEFFYVSEMDEIHDIVLRDNHKPHESGAARIQIQRASA